MQFRGTIAIYVHGEMLICQTANQSVAQSLSHNGLAISYTL